MRSSPRPSHWRVRVETFLGGLFVVLFAAMLVDPEWIEQLTGFDPDDGSGMLEWALPVVTLGVAVVFAVLARIDLRRLRADPSPEETTP